MAKKQKKIDLDNLTPEEEMKLEIAEEIGVYDKVLAEGWRSLSAKESGRMGGLIAKRKKMQESGLGEESNQNK
ncbi:MAG: small, acid-soluble spore protein, alpha/beta type [Lachnospiraceae bacterium]|nr:small, acid-soluble spore protein, alpha/beta type [Lachnospiraceae bacterium]